MKRLLIATFSMFALLAARLACSSVCEGSVQAGDFKVDHYIADPLLHRRWAVLVDCSHPERPWTSELVAWQGKLPISLPKLAPIANAVKTPPLIPAGAKVRLWRVDDSASIELSGTALEAGSTGQMIHVRIGRRGTVLEGKVRDAGSVELSVPSDRQVARWSTQ